MSEISEKESFFGYSWRVFASTAAAVGTYSITRSTDEARKSGCQMSELLLDTKLSWHNGKPRNPENLERTFGITLEKK